MRNINGEMWTVRDPDIGSICVVIGTCRGMRYSINDAPFTDINYMFDGDIKQAAEFLLRLRIGSCQDLYQDSKSILM